MILLYSIFILVAVYAQQAYFIEENVDYSAPFGLDDTDVCLKLKSKIPAAPEVFGFSEIKGKKLFPEYKYPRCEEIEEESDEWVRIDVKSKKLELHCERGQEGFFILGPPEEIKLANPNEAKQYWRIYKYTRPVGFKKPFEFVLATCRDPKEKWYLRDYNLLKQTESYKNAMNRISELQSATSTHKKPMMLVFLTADSFSRRHFFRKLKSTVSLLNNLHKGNEYAVFDFKLHNIIGADTSENQNRVFGEKWVKKFLGDQNIDFHGKDAIWTMLRDKGFMSLFASDACNHNIPASIGLNPEVDHITTLFYCAHYNLAGHQASKNKRYTQRCIGNHMSHWYAMNYTSQFIEAYPKANLWIYNHFTAAHEGSGQHAVTLDDDLEDYMKQLLFTYGKDREVVILLNGDHGMRYGDFMQDSEAIQEHRLPAMFFIARHSLLSSIPGSYSYLTHNSFRLTTKPDLRQTMLYLAHWQFDLPFEKTKSNFYNLIGEYVPNERSCADAEIPVWYCSTYLPLPLPEYIYDLQAPQINKIPEDHQIFMRFIPILAVAIVGDMNEQAYLNPHMKPGWLCKQLHLDKITGVNHIKINENSQIFKLMFSVKESKKAQFDVWVMTSSQRSQFDTSSEFLPKPILLDNNKVHYQILTVIRVDKYGGDCELLARAFEISPLMCICYSDLSSKKHYLETYRLGWNSTQSSS